MTTTHDGPSAEEFPSGTDTAKDAKRLGEPFFTSKGAGKDAGLSLAMIEAIVREAGGHIEMETEPGKGTTFRVFLPARTEQARSGSDPDCGPASG